MSTLTHPEAGEQAKQAAHAVLEATRARLIRNGRRALLGHLLKGHPTVTADDVRAAVTVPSGIDPVALGAVPAALARLGLIRRVGYTATSRSAGHARPTAVWALDDRDAAERWLDANPPLPEPTTADDTGGATDDRGAE